MGRKKNVAETTPETDITTTTEQPTEAQPEAATATEEPAPDAEPPKKPKKGRKAKGPKISRNATLLDLVGAYCADMEEQGKSPGTISSYRMELCVAADELGEDIPLYEITPEQVAEYFNCKRVTKLRSGKNKAKPSIDKTRRVLRLALVWAAENGAIDKAPIPEPSNA